jgi:hypothetical protein
LIAANPDWPTILDIAEAENLLRVCVLIQEAHEVRFAWIELEAIDRDLELLPCESALDLRAMKFCGNARLGPPTQPAAFLWIAIARWIDRHRLVLKSDRSIDLAR